MRVKALATRIIQQLLRDKRTMALMVAAPLLVLTFLYFIFQGGATNPKLGVFQVPLPLVERLQESSFTITPYESLEVALADLNNGKLDALLQTTDGKPKLTIEGSDPSLSTTIQLMLQHTMSVPSSTPNSPVKGTEDEGVASPPFSISYLYGSPDLSSFDYMGPILIGVFVFFFVFLVAGISFLKERTTGTLERLLASPIKRWELVSGYVGGFGTFTILQALFITGYSILVLGMPIHGSFSLVLLITLLLSLTALSLGTFLSAYANTEFQIIQFIPLVITPQVFFSGLFELEAMSPWLRWFAHLMPLHYGADALREVMIRGGGLSEITLDLTVLLLLTMFFMTANVLALRKHRRL